MSTNTATNEKPLNKLISSNGRYVISKLIHLYQTINRNRGLNAALSDRST